MVARWALVVGGILGALSGCERAREPGIVVVAPRGLDDGVSLAVEDLLADLEQVTGERPALRALPAGGCRDHRTMIVVLGEGQREAMGAPAPAPLVAVERGGGAGALGAEGMPRQRYTIHEERCGEDGRRVVLRGGSSQSMQWAIYDLAQRLGIRYFHPESTYYPEALEWPESPIWADESPAFRRRSLHAHRKHPIELSPPFGDERSPAMAAIQRRWIDWNVKMRQTEVDGWDPELVGDYAYRRGFGRVASLSLLGTQQGGRPILDPDDPRPEARQIEEAIDRALAPVPGAPPAHRLELQFGSSEFTELDPALTLARLALVTEDVGARYPGVAVEAINHGTFAPPRPPHGVRFFDLPGLAPPALGVQVHPLMFYDLERGAAGVYGNSSYQNLLQFIRAQAPVRRIVHYPESSWWLTFDLPVPLYLAPVTVDARAHDIALLRPLLADEDDDAAGVIGHHTFTSGQEWGYWLSDYCVAQMTWDPAIDGEGCVADFTDRLAQGPALREILIAVMERQRVDLRDPARLRLLVGSDDETEAGAAIGVVVHPLPPRPDAVLAWDDAAIAALEAEGLAPLRAMAADYHAWADRAAATLGHQSPAQAPWVREIVDGLRVFALRAEHAVAIYEAVIELRAARGGAPGRRAAAEASLERAQALTEAARAVIRGREAEYRYPPSLTIAGDERGTPGALANRTVYPFRVLSRTHRMHYWERPDRQVAALLAAGDDDARIRATATILRAEAPLRLHAPGDDAVIDGVAWGDRDGEAAGEGSHRYAAQGIYRWSARGRRGDAELQGSGEVAVVERRLHFPRGSIRVHEPASAEVLGGLLPGIEVGVGEDHEPFLAIAEARGEPGRDGVEGPLARLRRRGDQSVPGELRLTLRGLGELVIADAVLSLERGGEGASAGAAEVCRLRVAGSLVTDNLLELLLASGGFEIEGARAFLAERLGVTVATLPAKIPLVADADGHELGD